MRHAGAGSWMSRNGGGCCRRSVAVPESFPFALASPQSTHALAIQLDNQAENLAACLNLAVSSAETGSTMGDDTAAWRAASLIREVRQHIWFLRMTFIALHG